MNERPFSEVLAERDDERQRKAAALRGREWQSLAEWHEANQKNAKTEPLQQAANLGYQHLKARR